MKKIRKIEVAVAALMSLPLCACADGTAPTKNVAEQFKVSAAQPIRVNMDKGRLTVVSTKGDSLSYEVAFTPDQTDSWLDRFDKKKGSPTAQDYQDSRVSYDPAKGELTIQTGAHLNAIARISVPSTAPLDTTLEKGVAQIGPRPGKVNAFLDSGILEYDASALAPGECVAATINVGVVNNNKDVDCKTVAATLRGHTGTISVN